MSSITPQSKGGAQWRNLPPGRSGIGCQHIARTEPQSGVGVTVSRGSVSRQDNQSNCIPNGHLYRLCLDMGFNNWFFLFVKAEGRTWPFKPFTLAQNEELSKQLWWELLGRADT